MDRSHHDGDAFATETGLHLHPAARRLTSALLPTVVLIAVRRLVSLIFPEGTLLCAVALLAPAAALNDALIAITPHYALVVLAATAVLSARFDRSRVLVATALLGLSDLALRTLPTGVDALVASERVGYNALAVLLPLNLALFALLPERGIRTRAGILRVSIAALQAAGLVALVVAGPEAPAGLLAHTFFDGATAAWTPVPQTGLLAFGLTFGLLGPWLLWRPEPIDRGLFWATAAAFLGLHAAALGGGHSVHFAVAGVLLMIAVVESSHAMAYRDALTGLPTRRALDEALARLRRRPFTIAMIDIDHFKRFNDRHGHDVGDQVLRLVATHLARIPGSGKAYRYGGEEFAILFPGAKKVDCVPRLEALRKRIAEAGFVVRGPDRPRRKPKNVKRRARRDRSKALTVTVSIGAADRDHPSQSPDDIVRAADQALYRAKNAGRNRVHA